MNLLVFVTELGDIGLFSFVEFYGLCSFALQLFQYHLRTNKF